MTLNLIKVAEDIIPYLQPVWKKIITPVYKMELEIFEHEIKLTEEYIVKITYYKDHNDKVKIYKTEQ